jgi:hypothetical protein
MNNTGIFGVGATGEVMAAMALKNEDWRLDFNSDQQPVLYADVTRNTVPDVNSLKSALSARDVEYSERTRKSNGAKVIRVDGSNFIKLFNILGKEKFDQIERAYHVGVIESLDWKQGPAGDVLIAFSANIPLGRSFSAIQNSMAALGITGNFDKNDRSKINVFGKSMQPLVEALGISEGPAVEAAKAFGGEVGNTNKPQDHGL